MGLTASFKVRQLVSSKEPVKMSAVAVQTREEDEPTVVQRDVLALAVAVRPIGVVPT
jgi:hypothetical protein